MADMARQASASSAVPFVLALAALTTSVVSGAIPPQAAVTQPTFRARVDAVEVDTRVVDQFGAFVRDLKSTDFQILEDGQPQEIQFVRLVEVSDARRLESRGSSLQWRPDVSSNARPFEGRLYFIVLDDLHTSAVRTNLMRKVAREFVERIVSSVDLATVLSTSGNRDAYQEFTSDRTRLENAISRTVGRKVLSPGLAGLVNTATPDALSPEAAAAERINNGRSMFATLANLARFAATIPHRRKAVVLISEGVDYDLTKQVQTGSGRDSNRALRDGLKSFVDEASRANLVLYAFDPRAYTHGGDDFVDIASAVPVNPEGGMDIVRTTPLQDDLRTAQENLQVLAAETGGFAVFGSPAAITAGYQRVRLEHSEYYLLGYYPSRQAPSGGLRRIEVRVRRTGLSVHARKGYAIPTAAAGPPALASAEAPAGVSSIIRDALRAPLPVSGLTLSVAAVPMKGQGKEASVAVLVHVTGAGLRFERSGKMWEDAIELAVVAIDRRGQSVAGEKTTARMALNPSLARFASQAGVVFQTRFNAPPGLYQLRVAGRDAGTGHVGSVHGDLEVDDFTRGDISISGVALTAEQAGLVPSPKPDPMLQALLGGTPITVRDFERADVLVAAAEIYDNSGARSPRRTRVVTVVLANDSRIAFQNEVQLTSREFTRPRRAWTHRIAVPLRELNPGAYLLKIETYVEASPVAAADRAVPFHVR